MRQLRVDGEADKAAGRPQLTPVWTSDNTLCWRPWGVDCIARGIS